MFPNEYINYLIHFHGDRDYFECHEILEEYWKKVDPKNKHSIWVGLILLAVSSYHHRRGNFSGATRTLTKSINILRKNCTEIDKLGIHSGRLILDLDKKLKDLSKGKKYTSYIFPINDDLLISICNDKCKKAGLIWGADSALNNDNLIHRHSRRDRTQVIQERISAYHKKSNR